MKLSGLIQITLLVCLAGLGGAGSGRCFVIAWRGIDRC